MANERGNYGSNGLRIGEAPTVYVERGGMSTGAMLLGAVAIGGAVLYARHQAKQIQQLYKSTGVPYQTFTGSLRAALPSRARETYRAFTGDEPPVAVVVQSTPVHSVRARSSRK
jgi:hypothetical protein